MLTVGETRQITAATILNLEDGSGLKIAMLNKHCSAIKCVTMLSSSIVQA